MLKHTRNHSEKSLVETLSKNGDGLYFKKDRDETLSNYGPHSSTSYGLKKMSRFRYRENDDWEKTKERGSVSNRPSLTRIVYRCNRPTDPLSNEIYKKHYDPFLKQS